MYCKTDVFVLASVIHDKELVAEVYIWIQIALF